MFWFFCVVIILELDYDVFFFFNLEECFFFDDKGMVDG